MSIWYEESRKLDFVRPVRSHTIGGLSSSFWYEESSMRDFVCLVRSARREGSSLSIWYDESSRQDFVHPLQSRAKGEHVLTRLVWGIKQVGQHLSSSKSHNESLSTFIRYEESTIPHQMAPRWGHKYCILPCIHQSSPCAEYDPKHRGGWSTNQ